MVVNATTRVLYPRQRFDTVGPTAGIYAHGNLDSTGIRFLDCPVKSESLYRLRYFRPPCWKVKFKYVHRELFIYKRPIAKMLLFLAQTNWKIAQSVALVLADRVPIFSLRIVARIRKSLHVTKELASTFYRLPQFCHLPQHHNLFKMVT
jgi:hypothetical protein